MTLDEKLTLLEGHAGFPFRGQKTPEGAIGSAGFVPGVARLGIPSLQETDAGLGITDPENVRPGDAAVALPSALSLASAWDETEAEAWGGMLGREAASRGFNVLLGPGLDLARDPRGGRNFEYGMEDPLLAGQLAGAVIRGIQQSPVIAVGKHFALNDQESGRQVLDARIGEAAARESDWLAFEIALEQGKPGAVMCAYNRVNGPYACENPFLLNQVLKADWHYPGFVLSDWGAVHGTGAAAAGLDQESAAEFDAQPFFSPGALRGALAGGALTPARIDDMATRIVGAIAAAGLLDPQLHVAPEPARDLEIARRAAAAGAVLLRNQGAALPLPKALKRVLVVGGEADAGVLAGGGSSLVKPVGGFARVVAQSGPGPAAFHDAFFDPPSPLSRIAAKLPGASVTFDDGRYPARAAAGARAADAVIVFATQWSGEMTDIPDLALPGGQDATIEAVAAANPRTIVVLETGGPVSMPWRDRVAAIVEAWYPGSGGADAIADLLFGDADFAGRLPVTFPAALAQLPSPDLPGQYLPQGTPFVVDYGEGANIGYRWFSARRETPLYPFGFGLSYTRFALSGLAVQGGHALALSFDVRNAGARRGVAVAEAYLTRRPGGPALRLIGWARRDLAPGETAHVTIAANPRLLADYDAAAHRWIRAAGEYRVAVGAASDDAALTGQARLEAATAPP